MTPDQVSLLVAGGESEVLEFKNTTGSRREAIKTVCGMLNHRGGEVVFGVLPHGKAIGQEASDGTIEKLCAEIQLIDPPAFPVIERVRWKNGREILVVRVKPGSVPPCRYKGTPYRRVGNTTLIMSADEYNHVLLERMHGSHRWENQVATGWKLEDLELDEIRGTVAEADRIGRLKEPRSRDPEDLLRGLGLIEDGTILQAAAVLFGKEERLEVDLPQCLLRAARFRGIDRREFLDNRQFVGNAFALLSHAERFLRDSNPIASRFESGRMERIDEPPYPPLAAREALANAFCHRDYSLGCGSVGLAIYDDRMEVSSTGSLHFGLTLADLFEPHDSRPWSPLVARTFYRRGIIEEWGQGTLKMVELATDAGMPVPGIEDRGDCVTVCFRNNRFVAAPSSRDGIHERQKKILELLNRAEGGLALREISMLLGSNASERQVRRALVGLKESGTVIAQGRGMAARWKLERQQR